jgi:putative phosphoribosyl transferase
MTTRFKDRQEGGRSLAHLLADYAGRKDVLALAIPSGGVPVAAAIAQELECVMDVLMVRTLNVPWHDPWQVETVMGAVASGGVRVLDFGVLTSAKVQPQELEQVVAIEQQELERLQQLYRGDRPFPDLRGRTVVLATDAIVIGSSMEAGIRAARAKGAARVVVATPVGLASTCEHVQAIADEFMCLLQSPDFCSLALWYDDPRYTTDDEVRSLLAPHLQDEHDAVQV